MRQYFDYLATTPLAPEVSEAMQAVGGFEHDFANASAGHLLGRAAAKHVAHAASQVAGAIGAHENEVVWTSGATEANNLAIFGIAQAYRARGKHLITQAAEHKSVLNPFKQLQKQGYELTVLRPKANGLVDLDELAQAVREDTVLVSIMHVNNEVGTIYPLDAISAIVHAKGALLHVDAVQSLGKCPIDVKAMGVDSMSFSGHKAYAPKGIGALYLSCDPKVLCKPQQFGGTQQESLRPGTLPVQAIVAMGKAFELAVSKLEHEHQRITQIRDRFWQGIKNIPGIGLNTDLSVSIPHCLSVHFEGVDGESLALALDVLSVSAGSACNSTAMTPSHVLTALGVLPHLAHATCRFSFGRYSSVDAIDEAISVIHKQVAKLHQYSE